MSDDEWVPSSPATREISSIHTSSGSSSSSTLCEGDELVVCAPHTDSKCELRQRSRLDIDHAVGIGHLYTACYEMDPRKCSNPCHPATLCMVGGEAGGFIHSCHILNIAAPGAVAPCFLCFRRLLCYFQAPAPAQLAPLASSYSRVACQPKRQRWKGWKGVSRPR